MRRSTILVVAAFQQSCWGRHLGFNPHDDVVGYPQFEILFSENYIAEHEADSLLELGSSKLSESDRSLVQQTTPPQGQPISDGEDDDDDDRFEREVSETYELMNVPPNKYLCNIPVIEPPPPQNQTASELAKVEEARELVRATSAGWELIRDLEDTCLYFVSGWWSYQFCFGVEVVQYHAVQASPKDNIPIRDPHLQQYILGVDTDTIEPDGQPDPPSSDIDVHQDAGAGQLVRVPRNTELVLKGNQRYLVQHLEDGTICDLTGRPRTIEIQYHCTTGGNTDRIAWIKEVTTCAYLMGVHTPRLCKDIAFLPPKPTKAHAITCREILSPEQEEAWHKRKTLEAESKNPGAVFEKNPKDQKPINIGGIVVGSRNILRAADHDGQQARLPPPRSFQRGAQNSNSIVIASGKSKDKGGAVDILPDEAIADLDIDPQLVERVRQELHRYAGENGWRLEIIEQGGAHQMMAIVMTDDNQEEQLGVTIGPDEENDDEPTDDEQETDNTQDAGDTDANQATGKERTAKGDNQEPATNGQHDDDAGSQGSQEEFFEEGYFRDEL
ncbi:hypothetical protein MKZ38_002806 [Zalerion maritima]|uniref:Endoplasmic reticulum lectin n=1 Tax=Zalerion maritima TaxID=339359 RepID=A0AAD5RNJ0_9PEZI|nr:hypothetical protein MKZ38_002806 [Zalerion maritima]